MATAPTGTGTGTAVGEAVGRVLDAELADGVPALSATDDDGRRCRRVWLLVRLHGEPLALLRLDVPDGGLPAAAVREAVLAECGEAVAGRLGATGPHPDLIGDPLPVPATEPPFLSRRRQVLRDAPAVTVVVCTRDQPEALRRCLGSLLAQRYPRFEVLVVDNAPDPAARAATRAVAEAAGEARPPGAPPVRYAAEPRPGLSRARNRALSLVSTPLVAWLDDDETADPDWLAELARAFADEPAAEVVSGVVVPAEIRTDAQRWFEQFGGHSKGRGFTRAVFSLATADRQSPLFPLPPFGVGANMAFRTEALRRIGGFDVGLGAGTPARGGEDSLAFTLLLLGGSTMVYAPAAVTRHVHREDLAGLTDQLRGYGSGLTAFYTALLLRRPWLLPALIRLAPRALRELRGGGDRTATIEDDFPAGILGANRRAMPAGPFAYVRGRLRPPAG